MVQIKRIGAFVGTYWIQTNLCNSLSHYLPNQLTDQPGNSQSVLRGASGLSGIFKNIVFFFNLCVLFFETAIKLL